MIQSWQRGRRLPARAPRWQRATPAVRPSRRRLILEPLEDRTLLAVSISGLVWNDLNANGLRDGNEPGLPGTTVFLDQNGNGRFDGQDVNRTPASLAIGPDPLGFGVSATAPLTVTGLPAQVSQVRVNLDLTYNGPGTTLVGLLSPTGLQLAAGPNLIFMNPGDHFAGTFDDQASRAVTVGSTPFVGSFRPYNPLTDPGSHIYDGDPNGDWALLFISDSFGPVSGLTLRGWSLTFTVAEPSTQTDAAGNYAFQDLPPGQYSVGVASSSATVQTFPTGNALNHVTVAAGQIATDVNFGIKPVVTVSPPPVPIANQPITTGPGVHQQPSIAVDPGDPLHLVVAYMDYTLQSDGYAGLGVAVSRDGGTSWQQSSVPLPSSFDSAAGYPVVRFDAQSHVFVSYMAATFLGPRPPLIFPRGTDPATNAEFTSFAFQSNNGVFVSESMDGGTNWGQPIAIASHLFSGHPVLAETIPDLAIDTFALRPDGTANPNFGNLYLTWTRAYPSGQFPGDSSATGGTDVMVAVSRDGGQTWMIQLHNGVSTIQFPDNNGAIAEGNGFINFSHAAVGPEGDLYISLNAGGAFEVYHSTDAGASFRNPDNTFGQQNGIPFVLPNGANRAFPEATLSNNQFRTLPVRDIAIDPAHPGTVYAVEAIKIVNPNTNQLVDAAEINFAASRDYGQTWEQVFRVGNNPLNLGDVPQFAQNAFVSVLNDDDGSRFLSFASSTTNEVIAGQALPHLSVDAQGNISVIWYDTRRDPANHLLDVFGTTSTDRGQHFAANYRVSDTSVDADAGAFTNAIGKPDFFLGDAISLASANGTNYAVWTDTRSGNQQIVFARYSVNPAPGALDDRFEPNDTPQAATDLGTVAVQRVIPRLVVAPQNDDWFRLEAAATGDLIVVAQSASPGASFLVELRDSSGANVLATATDVINAGGQVIGEQLHFAAASGEVFLVHVGGASAPISYSLTVQSLTADLGTRVEGSVTGEFVQGGKFVYRLSAAVTGLLQVRGTTAASYQGGFIVQILSADGGTVLASQLVVGPNQLAQVSVPVAEGQTVLLQVRGRIRAMNKFSLEFTNLDQLEISQPIQLFFPTEGTPSAIAIADLNGDGKPDLISASTDLVDGVDVLMGNGDGTFQASRGFDVGPGSGLGLRDLAIGDFNHDGRPDVAVTNFTGADVSVLPGRGDGTLQPARRSDASVRPDSLAVGDFNGDGILDLVTLQRFSVTSEDEGLAVLLGRGDGTFAPPNILETTFDGGAFPVLVGDLNHDGKADLVALSFNDPGVDVYLGNGDGTFRAGQFAQTAENTAAARLVDLNGDGNLDLITTGTVDAIASILLGNGDGTFQKPRTFVASSELAGVLTGVNALVVADLGSESGPPDGHPDLLVTVFPTNSTRLPQLILIPSIYDSTGHFTGLGDPQVLAVGAFERPLAVGDLNGDGVMDIAIAEKSGILVLFGQPANIVANDTPQSARNLGTSFHVSTSSMAIVPGHEDAFFTFTVPTEVVQPSGLETVDFSTLVKHAEGTGLTTEVRDSSGRLLSSGDRFRLQLAQGQTVLIHVFGVADASGVRGNGSYRLLVDVLPQVASVVAEAALPGKPATNLVLTIQGDRLDSGTAEDPANFQLFYLGPDGRSSPQLVPIGADSIMYDPDAKLASSSGKTLPGEVRQTITILFAQPLAAGSYQLVLSPRIQTQAFDTQEEGQLVNNAVFSGHPLVFTANGLILNGSALSLIDLVSAATVGTADQLPGGTLSLTEFHDNLAIALDDGLTHLGDTGNVTSGLLSQIVAQFAPAVTAADGSQTPVLVLFLDPVSVDLVDPQGKHATYDLQRNTVSNQLPRAFVEVGGNIEVLVLADVTGKFRLNLADVQPEARGGAVILGTLHDTTVALTDLIQQGARSFDFDLVARSILPPPPTPTPNPQPTGDISGILASLLTSVITTAILAPANASPGGPDAAGFDSGGAANTAAARVGSAGESGGGGVASLMEQVVREFSDRLGSGLTQVAEELGTRGRTITSNGLQVLQAPAQAITTALQSVGWPNITLPAPLFRAITDNVLQAVTPALKALGTSIQPFPSTNPKAPPNGRTQSGPIADPAPEDVQLAISEQPSESGIMEIDDRSMHAALAAALFAAGLFHGRWMESAEESMKTRNVMG